MINNDRNEIFIIMLIALLLNGCVLTKVVTVPMRIGGAIISIVPGVGETVHDVVDKAAEKVDKLPL